MFDLIIIQYIIKSRKLKISYNKHKFLNRAIFQGYFVRHAITLRPFKTFKTLEPANIL